MKAKIVILIVIFFSVFGCSRLSEVGTVPEFTPAETSAEAVAMRRVSHKATGHSALNERGSLWGVGRHSLLGDRRAKGLGDILTVVIEIDEGAEISNSSSRSRNAKEDLQIGAALGLPDIINPLLPGEGSLDNAADMNSSSQSNGNGSISRNESLELKVAATVVDVLETGILQIQGSQEVRVNFEVRELFITGFVRPEDINRFSEVTYERIAAARISYGGRGHISDVQQPRYGQQVADILLPF